MNECKQQAISDGLMIGPPTPKPHCDRWTRTVLMYLSDHTDGVDKQTPNPSQPNKTIQRVLRAMTPRLLYRGSLSLPDSLLRLDGLTFTTSSTSTLLKNPLALALESMRGRPCLRFLGLCVLDQVHIDGTEHDSVFMYAFSVRTSSNGSDLQ